ncbi:MAG TPA: amidohydrolase [Gemmatimonadales bacterium]
MPDALTRGSGLLRARRVLTMVPGLDGESLWWENGRIRGVGSASEMERAAPRGILRLELPEALVTPGMVDGHTHLAMWALNRRRVELSGSLRREEVIARVAAARPLEGWIVGQGWDANGWLSPPHRLALDGVQQGPVYLDSLDVHGAWVNSAALAAAGITRDTPDPFGGRIVRDANGDPTGLLLERAVELVTPCLPEPSARVLDEALRDAQAEAHRLGVTGIHEVESMAVLDAFRRLDAAAELRLRVLFHPPVAALSSLIAGGVRSGQGSEWLRLGGVKMFLDGSLGSRTAWMLEPYAGTRDRGMPITGEKDVRDAMTAAAAAGISSTVHAIGDAAVRRALDLLSVVPRLSIPHRIEHFQCVSPSDLNRAPGAGIVLSMQPAHLLTDIELVERHWGERGRGAYAFRSLLQRGARLVFGSDVPVASLDPRVGIHAALERKGFNGAPANGWRPEEKIGFSEVVAGYTMGAAHAAGVGHWRGRLAPGFDADLVAWAVDPAAEQGDGEAFLGGHAALTVVGGDVVMRA